METFFLAIFLIAMGVMSIVIIGSAMRWEEDKLVPKELQFLTSVWTLFLILTISATINRGTVIEPNLLLAGGFIVPVILHVIAIRVDKAQAQWAYTGYALATATILIGVAVI